MRSCHVSCLLLAALASAVGAADPAVRIPQPAPLPTPMPPAPDPGGVVSLGVEELYVVESDAPLAIRSFPKGLVAFERIDPGTVYGKFAGGSGKWEKRLLKGPHVYVGTAAGQGRAELVFVPIGLKAESEIVEARVDCLAGPRPPPVPPTPPDPKPPEPKPPEPDPAAKSPWDNATGLRVLVVYPKRGALPAEQQSIVTGKRVRDFLDANTAKEGGQPAYWILKTDEDVTGLPATWQKAYATQKGDRWVVVGNGAKWEAGPLPADPDKMLELLGKYK